MESSSDDSFCWTDTSNDSSDNIKNKSELLMEANYEGGSEFGANCKQKEDTDFHNENENETKTKRKKTKKRKCSEGKQESSDCSPERKRIKLEPESDIDVGKKKKNREKNIHKHDVQDSLLINDDYLNLTIKEEQFSVQTKKKNKLQKSISNAYTANNNKNESDLTIVQNTRSSLDFRVKQEQASVAESSMKSKKNKKRQKPSVGSDMDIKSESKSAIMLSNATDHDHSSGVDEQSEYTIIEEKFSAEETTVEKRRKKKHKVEVGRKHSLDEAAYVKSKSGLTSEEHSDHHNDTSLEPNDFTCNNIVSSTIINNSAMNSIDKDINKAEDLATKISDRIRFQEDDNLNQRQLEQEPLHSKISTKINMFLKVNPHLKLCTPQTSKECMITEDDEIWSLKWPHEISLGMLRNTTLSCEGKCKIKIDGQSYEGIPNVDVIPVTLLIPQHEQSCITNLPVQVSINYQKVIPKVHIPNNNIMVNNQTNFTPLPETKFRHPLFGPHYKKATKLASNIAQRLQTAKDRYKKTVNGMINKRKSKKSIHESSEIKTEEECVRIKPEPIKKKKKRKHNQDNDDAPSKSKDVKHIADSPVAWESEKCIEENLFNF